MDPNRGQKERPQQPFQQALLGWRAQLWIWFLQNTKPPAQSLSPRHWGLCQACAHPLCPCQGGGWAGCMGTVAPAGPSSRGPIFLLKPSPASLSQTELLRLRGEPKTLQSSCVGQRAPRPRVPHALPWCTAQAPCLIWANWGSLVSSQESLFEHLQ